MSLIGRAGGIYAVKVTATPSEGIRSGTSVAFSAKVTKGLDDEKVDKYTWDFGDGATSSDAEPTHTYANKKRKQFTVTLTAEGDQESIGQGQVSLNVKKPLSTSPGTGGGGSGSGGTGNGGSGGTPGGGGGGTFGNNTYTPPSTLPTTPSPSLPAPQTPPPSSSPPTDSGSAPDNPGFDTTPSVQEGTEVTGILVSAPSSASSGKSGSKATPAPQPAPKDESKTTDWKIPVGIVLAALLLILGALRERMPVKRLLPSANETGDVSAQPT
jgi:hypothetical protein